MDIPATAESPIRIGLSGQARVFTLIPADAHGWGGQRIDFMWTYLWIACGGALGSVARYACSGLVANSVGEQFPWGTLAVNVAGSFLIGLFAGLTAPEGRWLVQPPARQFFMIGLMGGFTTFSSFSLQTLELINDGQWGRAGTNVILSVLLCLLGVWIGHSLAMAINSTGSH